ncbi:AAA family ATPase [Chenggangzhangella methanolivorans]|uniref:ATP-binding protein n=1 Tax=Chenggangzhangella methanolivorans TaxID=1437009 RepID=A0A9E6RD74_9HYPH|nr:ATP-binding protein [Chenggangzhangella methanolivorans]QZO01138.1 ATP-binding protein [Chenggangzhangella methanolivorans]
MSRNEDADAVGERPIARPFRQIFVEIVVDQHLTPDIIDACVQDQITVVIDAPTEIWANALAGPIAGRCQSLPLCRRPYVFKRGAPRKVRTSKEDTDLETLQLKLSTGASVIALFCPASEPLPILTDSADIRIEIMRPTTEDVAKALSEATATPVDAGLIAAVNTIDLDGLCALVRPRASAEQTLQRFKIAIQGGADSDGIPTIHQLAGYGDAKRWALSALHVIESIRAGEPGVTLADLPRGALLVGPPGTGKSIFAQSLAKTLGVGSVITSVSEWLSTGDTHLGTVISAARASIAKASSFQPGLLFIDEVDSLVDRDQEKGSSASWWLNFVNAVLSAIDGAVKVPGLVVVGACNDLNRVDKALRRSGRLETIVHIGLPNEADRLSIFDFYVKGAVSRADLRSCAIRSGGMSGADIQRAVREARQLARERHRRLTLKDLHEALSPRIRLDDAETRTAAGHEAGHALASLLLGDRLIAVDVDRALTHLHPLPRILDNDLIDWPAPIEWSGWNVSS